jgi:hypothetical protein
MAAKMAASFVWFSPAPHQPAIVAPNRIAHVQLLPAIRDHR